MRSSCSFSTLSLNHRKTTSPFLASEKARLEMRKGREGSIRHPAQAERLLCPSHIDPPSFLISPLLLLFSVNTSAFLHYLYRVLTVIPYCSQLPPSSSPPGSVCVRPLQGYYGPGEKPQRSTRLLWAWRKNPEVCSTCCSCKASKFSFQHPYGSS